MGGHTHEEIVDAKGYCVRLGKEYWHFAGGEKLNVEKEHPENKFFYF